MKDRYANVTGDLTRRTLQCSSGEKISFRNGFVMFARTEPISRLKSVQQAKIFLRPVGRRHMCRQTFDRIAWSGDNNGDPWRLHLPGLLRRQRPKGFDGVEEAFIGRKREVMRSEYHAIKAVAQLDYGETEIPFSGARDCGDRRQSVDGRPSDRRSQQPIYPP